MTVISLRETLVATGVEILDADGPTELTLREIARRAGVSHGAPRRYFPTHNSLLAAIAFRGLVDLTDRLDPILTGKQSARDRLISAAVEYVSFAQERPARPHHNRSIGSRSCDGLRVKTAPVAGSRHSAIVTASPAAAVPSSTENQCATAAPQAIGSAPVLRTETVRDDSPALPRAAGSAAPAVEDSSIAKGVRVRRSR
ncbi:MAG: TetR/AcrR family transcriptional regulator [Hyphomicrobiaceae bacterium]